MNLRMCCLAAGAALLLWGAPARAMQTPTWVAEMGGTTLVSGSPGGGGASASLSALWDVEPPLTFGLMVFADDMGTSLGRLRDPNYGVDVGAVATRHRLAYGAGWRFDAALPVLSGWGPYASVMVGAYRIQDDARGQALVGVSSTGASLGAGVRRPVLGAGSLGAVVRWDRVARGPTKGWLSAGMDWAWRWGSRP